MPRVRPDRLLDKKYFISIQAHDWYGIIHYIQVRCAIKQNNMRKIIAGMNMTLDGFCDHTAMIADDEIHQHYNELLSSADTLI